RKLSELEKQGLLKSELIKGFAKNDLVDSKGEVKLMRFTKVFKKVYTLNDESKAIRKFVKSLKSLSKELFKKNLSQVLCNDELMESLA
ncbi:MAG: hypothetical protein QXH53_05625, partial [Nitrososphaerales archaeon]